MVIGQTHLIIRFKATRPFSNRIISARSQHELLVSLGLNLSDESEDDTCNIAMDQMECGEEREDELCNRVMDGFERQRAFQDRFIEQSGGAMNREVGSFHFDLEPFVDRWSTKMGVRERHFNTRLRQTGNYVDQPHVVRALEEGLRRAIDRVLDNTDQLDEQDRLFFTLSSNRLNNNFQGWGIRVGEWRQGGARVNAVFTRMASALNSNEQFEMDDSLSSLHYSSASRAGR